MSWSRFGTMEKPFGKIGSSTMKNLEFYKEKKVFVTGHTGFKGSWLTTCLNLCGAQVKGYSLPPENDNGLYNLLSLEKKCVSVFGDIRDKEKLREEILSFQPHLIFHLAAQPLVRDSYKKPIDTYEVNVIGTANLLSAVGELGNKCTIVIITTDKVYENKEWMYPYREVDKLGGYDPYSSSKACCEILIDSFRNSFFNIKNYDKHYKAIASARAGNVIGGGDWSKDRIIPDIVNSLSKEENIRIRNPSAIRPWQHVIEPIYGYLKLCEKLDHDPMKYTGAWNFGPELNADVSVCELVKIAIDEWGNGKFVNKKDKKEPHEAGILKLDISKTKSILKWNPIFSQPEAIRLTINWYKEVLFGGNPEELIKGDIEKYLEKAN